MRQAFAPLDDVLIERVFQPLSDAMWHHIGLQRARAASICVELAIVAWVASQAPGLSAAGQAGSAMAHLAMLLLGITALLSLRRLFWRAAFLGG